MTSTYNTSSPAQVHAAQSRGETVPIADVRTPAEFEAVHVQEARSHPLDDLEAERVVASFGIEGLGRERPLYLTCQSGRRAAMAADRLAAAGYRNVVLIDGGTEAWEAAKLPVVRGRVRRVLPLPQQVQVAVGALLLLKTLLGATVHPLFFALTAALGAGLIYAGLTQNCALAQLLRKVPWKRARTAESAA